MNTKLIAALVLVGSMAIGPTQSMGAQHHAGSPNLGLSPDVLEILRTEMRELAGGVHGLAVAIATADWSTLQQTSEKIRSSYIMEQSLTPAQAEELDEVLPAQFKLLDAEFHQRAEKLGAAAASHDAELVTFHYSRLIESCVRCHSAFAGDRFTGFAAPPQQSHQHGSDHN